MIESKKDSAEDNFNNNRRYSVWGFAVPTLTSQEEVREDRHKVGSAKCLSAGEALTTSFNYRGNV